MQSRAITRNYILKELVENNGFRPLTDASGNILRFDHIDILQKKSWGAVFIFELIDGDYFSEDEMVRRLENGYNAIRSIEGQYPVVLIEAFTFENGIPESKLRLLEDMLGKMQWYKRYITSFCLDMVTSRVIRLFEPPVNLEGLEKILDRAVMLDERFVKSWEYSMDPYFNQDTEKNRTRSLRLSDKKIVVSYALIAINALIWLITYFYGKMYDVNANMIFGAKFNPLIMEGQYWRLITPIFLHGGLLHLAVNSYSLYAVGPTVEKLYGPARIAVIYLVAGIMGNVASFIFSINPSVGASGAIFGLLGALLYMGHKYRDFFRRTIGRDVIVTIVFNIAYGFTQSGIDNYAHIGGLIGGYLAAWAVGLLGEKGLNKAKVLSWVAILILVAGGVYIGFNMPANIELKMIYDYYINFGK